MRNPEANVQYLRQVPLFQNLSSDELLNVATLMDEVPYPQGSLVARQGEVGATFYIVKSGTLYIWAIDLEGKEEFGKYLNAGDYFGETSLLIGEPRDATIEVAGEANLLYINKRDFDKLLSLYPEIRKHLNISQVVREKLGAPHFPWEREGEVTILLSRKHWFVLARYSLLSLFLFFLMYPVMWLTRRVTNDPMAIGTTGVFLLGIPMMSGLWLFLDWWNDFYVVTNQRVLHIEKVILFYGSRIETTLDRVQDIDVVIPGILPRLLGYANIRVQTAGTGGQISFSNIGNAEQVKEAIFEQVRRARARERVEERQRIKRDMFRQFGMTEPRFPSAAESGEQPNGSKSLGASVVRGDQASLLLEALGQALGYFVPRTREQTGSMVVWRKHWFILLQRTWWLLGILLVSSGFLVVIGIRGLLQAPVILGLSSIPLMSAIWLLWRYADWHNDIYILTDDRIIDIEKLPLGFFEDRREASLSQIQDVKLVIPNLLANLFNYGNVDIETAGKVGLFTFEKVYNPRGVQEEIFNRWAMYREREVKRVHRESEAVLQDWFAVYDGISATRK